MTPIAKEKFENFLNVIDAEHLKILIEIYNSKDHKANAKDVMKLLKYNSYQAVSKKIENLSKQVKEAYYPDFIKTNYECELLFYTSPKDTAWRLREELIEALSERFTTKGT